MASQKENVRANMGRPQQYPASANGIEDLKTKLERFRNEREQSKNNLMKLKSAQTQQTTTASTD
jgi:hypothetical protein